MASSSESLKWARTVHSQVYSNVPYICCLSMFEVFKEKGDSCGSIVINRTARGSESGETRKTSTIEKKEKKDVTAKAKRPAEGTPES